MTSHDSISHPILFIEIFPQVHDIHYFHFKKNLLYLVQLLKGGALNQTQQSWRFICSEYSMGEYNSPNI